MKEDMPSEEFEADCGDQPDQANGARQRDMARVVRLIAIPTV
jgi:hypothetical protein